MVVATLRFKNNNIIFRIYFHLFVMFVSGGDMLNWNTLNHPSLPSHYNTGIITNRNVPFNGGIPYTAHGAQITPPLIFDFFVFMLILG